MPTTSLRLSVARPEIIALLLAVVTLTIPGCKAKPDYAKALPPGRNALRLIDDPAQWPDVGAAFAARDGNLGQALDRSIAWFEKPSSQQYFPVSDITHRQAYQSLIAFRKLLSTSPTAEAFAAGLQEQFDAYQSVGFDDRGSVFFTGYCSPILTASTTRTAQYRYPLYQPPADLVTDFAGGRVTRRVGNQVTAYPTRHEIESAPPAALGLAGRELVYLADPFEVYVIHVNGSAMLRLTDGSIMHVGYAASNGREYSSVGKILVQERKIPAERLSLPTLRAYFREHPEEVSQYTHRNDRYIFFKRYEATAWPSGSLGVPVTAWRTLATDKAIFPRGCVTLVQTRVPTAFSQPRQFTQWMLDQDAGGAIRAAGRADIFMGIGPDAETLAGRQTELGKLYYFFLKPSLADR